MDFKNEVSEYKYFWTIFAITILWRIVSVPPWHNYTIHTDGSRILHTLLVKHYNVLLYRQRSGRGKNEVTYFYVGDVFCIHLGTKYADFQEKIFAEISEKKFQTLGIT